jgi:hypothetical protein
MVGVASVLVLCHLVPGANKHHELHFLGGLRPHETIEHSIDQTAHILDFDVPYAKMKQRLEKRWGRGSEIKGWHEIVYRVPASLTPDKRAWLDMGQWFPTPHDESPAKCHLTFLTPVGPLRVADAHASAAAFQAKNLRALEHVTLSVNVPTTAGRELIERYARQVLPSGLLIQSKRDGPAVPSIQVTVLEEGTDWKSFRVTVKIWEQLQIPRNHELVYAETWTAMFGDQSELLPIGIYHDEAKAFEWVRKAIDQFCSQWRESNVGGRNTNPGPSPEVGVLVSR